MAIDTGGRPLSPHLQVYRPQMTSMLSIFHRATGVLLSLGTIGLALWLMAAATGPEAFAQAQACAGSWLGKLALFGWSFALFFHLCNGIRHLIWDAGYGLDIESTYTSGYVVLGAAAALTLLTWLLA